MKSGIIAAIIAAVVSEGAATATTAGLFTGVQVKYGSLGLVDLSASAKRALKGQRGPAGPSGVQGVQGIQGIAGGFYPAKVSSPNRADKRPFTPGEIEFVEAICPAGTKLLGDG